MYILGVSCHYHDSAAALINNGQLVAAAEEERFTRVKHDASFPKQAIRFCLKKANISKDQIDWVVFYERHFARFEMALITILQTFPKSYKLFTDTMLAWFSEKLWVKNLICEELKISPDKVVFTPHHIAHAASAYYCSPYSQAAVITADAIGEWTTTTIGLAKKNKLKILKEVRFPHSLGLFYSAFTSYLGFEVNDGEHKVMGMAAYGQPKFKDQVEKILKVLPDGSFRLDLDYFAFLHSDQIGYGKKFAEVFGHPRPSNQPFFIKGKAIPSHFNKKINNLELQSDKNQHYANIAASSQTVLEKAVLAIAQQAYKITGLKNLCFAGGVALNSVANGKLARAGLFDSIFVQPAATDAGGAIGAAFYFYHHLLDKPRSFVMEHAFWGPESDEKAVGSILQKNGVNFDYCQTNEQLIHKTAKFLSDGNVIGWFQNNSEWGPRALGNRSILADPRDGRMKDKINLKVKFREPFRPFAPAVLNKEANKFFNLTKSEEHLTKFMLTVAKVKSVGKKALPATTHIDGTSRVQVVDEKINPSFYHLIEQFEKISKVPVLLNTSFNLKNEPIVASADDALKTFKKSGLDILVLNNFLVFK